MTPARAAVLGGGFGGITAAGLLARAGVQVTLFEQARALGGKAGSLRVGATVLDTGPTLLTMPEVVRGTFDALDAGGLLPPLHRLDHQCHHLFADGCTFDTHQDLDRTAESAAALRPVEGRGVRSFYAEAARLHRAAGEPYLEATFEGMGRFMARVARRGLTAVAAGLRLGTLQALADRHFRSDHLRQFAGRFATYAGASPYEASAAFALIAHLEQAHGTFHPTGGIGALATALGRALDRLDVTVRLGARASWRREGAAFLVGPAGHEERFDALVINADPLASQGRAGEALALSGYVLLLEVPERLTLPHHTVLFSADPRREFGQLFSGIPADDPTLYLCHPAATDPTMAAPGTSGLLVMANAPPTASSADCWPDAERLRAQLLERLTRQFPGWMPRARVIGERTPADFFAQGAPGGSLYGFLPHGTFGPFRRPRIRGDQPGLFYAGGGTHPGGGVPLVMLSGRFAAEGVVDHLRAQGRL